MATRSKASEKATRNVKQTKKHDEETYENYEFLDDEEEDNPYSPDASSDEYKLEKEDENHDDDEEEEKIKKKGKKMKPLKTDASKNPRKDATRKVDMASKPNKSKSVDPLKSKEQNADEASKPDASTSVDPLKPMERKRKHTGTNDDKAKLASIIKGEEIIYNFQHPLHSNLSALSAAWERVAKAMDKPRMINYYLYL